MFGKKKKAGPQTDEQMLMEALGQLEKEVEKRDKRRARRYKGKHLLPAWLEGRVVIGLIAIVIIIVGDGIRRENQEFVATLTSTTGNVTVQETEDASPVPPQPNQKLLDGWVVNTGTNSYATIEFPDGSVSVLDQETVFVVKLMEYSRGGRWRSRSFYLRMGRVWSNVGAYFGAQSRMRIFTPTAVAAVRGTQYAVAYDPRQNRTVVTCNEGVVTSDGFRGQTTWVGSGGQTSVDYGEPPSNPQWMDPEARTAFAQPALHKTAKPPSWIKTAELTVTQVLDAPLSILGIGKCSWARGAADLARTAAAMEALRYIMQFMEGSPKYPDFVNPATLEELGIPYKEARRILSAFDGAALEKYEPMEGRSYRITVRARDRKRTLFVLTPVGIEQIKEEAKGPA